MESDDSSGGTEGDEVKRQTTTTSDAALTSKEPSSPTSPAQMQFSSTPETSPNTSSKSSNSRPSTPNTSSPTTPLRQREENTFTPVRVADPPTPVNRVFATSPDTPDSGPSAKRRRRVVLDDKLPSRETIKRQLLQTQDSKYANVQPQADEAPLPSTVDETTLAAPQLPAELTVPGCSGHVSSTDSDADSVDVEEVFANNEEYVSSASSSDGDSESDSGDPAGGSEDETVSQSSRGSDTSDKASASDGEEAMSDEEGMLYPGADLSVAEAVLKIMNLYVKHHWTKKCLADTLQTVKSLLPDLNDLPPTVYKLFQFVEGYSTVPPAQKHWYCANPECFKPKDDPTEICSSCENEGSSKFFHFSIADQIKFLFEQRNLSQLIDSYKSHRDENASDVISDISSGEEYARVKSELSGQYDIVLLWNTDGVSVADSSGISLWPILCEISEIAPELRSSFLLVAGVWCDIKKPPMNLFLEPFATSLANIKDSGGVEWTHPSGLKHRSIVVAPLLTADAPAKAECLQQMYVSALYGCNSCEQKRAKVKAGPGPENQGQKRQGGGKTGKKSKSGSQVMRRFVYQDRPAALRSGQSMDRQGVEAEEKKKPVKGVLGRAAISKIPLLDRGRCLTAEYMHCVLLGVVKYFLLLWLFSAGPWFIGNHIKDIDNFIKNIDVPDFVNRLPKGVKDAKNYWKASEFRSWLIYYSLPALDGILPEKFFQHWILLVQAIFTLLQDCITDVELNKAHLMLKTFVRDIKHLYGEKYYTYNVHMLLHLCMLVKRWGPLWATSAFPFESHNAILGSLIHGTKNKGQELVNQLKLAQGVVCLENFVQRSKGRAGTKSHGCVCYGRRVKIDLSNEQLDLLSKANLQSCSVYGRAANDREKYSSFLYDKKKK